MESVLINTTLRDLASETDIITCREKAVRRSISPRSTNMFGTDLLPRNYSCQPQIPSPLSSSPLRAQSLSPLPLTPRSPNVISRHQFPMSSPTPGADANTKPANARRGLKVPRQPLLLSHGGAMEKPKAVEPFAKRTVKRNPLIHNNADGHDRRETRRNLFLRKVREDSEDRRWQARGGDDELMRTIWIAEQKRREVHKALEAEYVPLSQEEEVEEVEPGTPDMASRSSGKHEDERDIIERMAQQEEDELEAMLSMMDVQCDDHAVSSGPSSTTPYGSDDEDYDNAFMEYFGQNSAPNGTTGDLVNPMNHCDHEMMDMS